MWKGIQNQEVLAMKKTYSAIALASLVLIVLVVAVGTVHAQEKPRFARATESQNDVWVLRIGEEEWEPCGVNTPLGESDIVETEDKSYSEIQFDDGLILSLNEDTRVDLKQLSYNDRGGRSTVLFLHYGSVRARVPSYAGTEDYLGIQLPSGKLYLDDRSEVRVNVKGSTAAEILVYGGEAKLEAKNGVLSIRGGERAYLDSDGYHGSLGPIPRETDDFDRWCLACYDKYGSTGSAAYLPGGVYYIGAYDLDRHGEWVFIAEYGNCWRPRVAAGWYPYCDGHWVYSHRWGWTWVSYEPWGWMPYHYGSWVNSWRWGWVWVPGRVWGPAWVAWVYYGDCIGWAPLCPWGYPCYCYDYGCHGPWTYVYRYSFYHPHWRYGYRGRGHGRYKYYAWGEKRYKYRDGKEHRMEDYSLDGPKNPEIAMKDFKPTPAEAELMKEEARASSEVAKPVADTKAPSSASVESRTLPSKPSTEAVGSKTSSQKATDQSRTQEATRSDQLPPKPKKTEESVQESSNEKAETRSDQLPAKPAKANESNQGSSYQRAETTRSDQLPAKPAKTEDSNQSSSYERAGTSDRSTVRTESKTTESKEPTYEYRAREESQSRDQQGYSAPAEKNEGKTEERSYQKEEKETERQSVREVTKEATREENRSTERSAPTARRSGK
jgi:hypothetical protein